VRFVRFFTRAGTRGRSGRFFLRAAMTRGSATRALSFDARVRLTRAARTRRRASRSTSGLVAQELASKPRRARRARTQLPEAVGARARDDRLELATSPSRFSRTSSTTRRRTRRRGSKPNGRPDRARARDRRSRRSRRAGARARDRAPGADVVASGRSRAGDDDDGRGSSPAAEEPQRDERPQSIGMTASDSSFEP
jgi:hypothetical protein